jgi:hypothetical protein
MYARQNQLGDWMDAITGAVSSINWGSVLSAGSGIYGDITKLQAAKAQAAAQVAAAQAAANNQVALIKLVTGASAAAAPAATSVPVAQVVSTLSGPQVVSTANENTILIYGGLGLLAVLAVIAVARE